MEYTFEDYLDEACSSLIEALYRDVPDVEVEETFLGSGRFTVWAEEGDEVRDPVPDFLKSVREGDEEAIRVLLRAFPCADGKRWAVRTWAEYLGHSHITATGDVELEARCPWFDTWDEAHYANGVVILSQDNTLTFRPSGCSFKLPLDRLTLRSTGELDDLGRSVYRIG